MRSKTKKTEIILQCRRLIFRHHRNLNSASSSQNVSPNSDHDPSSSSYFYDYCARTGYPILRLLPAYLTARVQFLQFSRTFSRSFCRKACAQHSPVRPSSMKRLSRRSLSPCNLSLGPEKLAEIVEEILRDADDMETDLDKLSFMLSPTTVIQVLKALNDRYHPVERFMDWVLNYHSDFNPNSEIYNLIVDNLGRLEDYSSMYTMLLKLSVNGHCLTEQSFTFVKLNSFSTIKDTVRRVTEVLNSIRGSCRGSGIHSLIKLLCAINSFDLALFVMEETVRKTSYYNLLIAAKCRHGNFREALHIFDEMKIHSCDPNTKSYNYLLGKLFKHNRVVIACELLKKMEEAGYIPDLITYEVVVLHACKANRTNYAIEILNLMLSKGLKPRPTTHAAFIKGFFLSGQVANAHNYVIEMSVKDKCSSNLNYSLLASLFQLSGRTVEAGNILHEMMQKGLKPNFLIFVTILKKLRKISLGDFASELNSMFMKLSSTIDAG